MTHTVCVGRRGSLNEREGFFNDTRGSVGRGTASSLNMSCSLRGDVWFS